MLNFKSGLVVCAVLALFGLSLTGQDKVPATGGAKKPDVAGLWGEKDKPNPPPAKVEEKKDDGKASAKKAKFEKKINESRRKHDLESLMYLYKVHASVKWVLNEYDLKKPSLRRKYHALNVTRKLTDACEEHHRRIAFRIQPIWPFTLVTKYDPTDLLQDRTSVTRLLGHIGLNNKEANEIADILQKANERYDTPEKMEVFESLRTNIEWVRDQEKKGDIHKLTAEDGRSGVKLEALKRLNDSLTVITDLYESEKTRAESSILKEHEQAVAKVEADQAERTLHRRRL